jgi:hypothetical protein
VRTCEVSSLPDVVQLMGFQNRMHLNFAEAHLQNKVSDPLDFLQDEDYKGFSLIPETRNA